MIIEHFTCICGRLIHTDADWVHCMCGVCWYKDQKGFWVRCTNKDSLYSFFLKKDNKDA